MSSRGNARPAASEGEPREGPFDLIRAAGRALIVLVAVLDLRLLGWMMRKATREPRVDEIQIDGVRVELVRPGGKGPWPGFIFVTGAHPLRRREPIVQKVAQGLARAGFLVLVPDLPVLGEGTITPQTLESTLRVVEWTARNEEVERGRVALCGASVGASLALLVAQQPELRSRISVVSSISPFADLERMICLATTRCYDHGGQTETYEAAILLRRVVARSMLSTLPAGAERTELLTHAGDILDDDRDAIDDLCAVDLDPLGPDARAVMQLLRNSEPDRFATLYSALPNAVHLLVNQLSPLRRAASVASNATLVASGVPSRASVTVASLAISRPRAGDRTDDEPAEAREVAQAGAGQSGPRVVERAAHG